MREQKRNIAIPGRFNVGDDDKAGETQITLIVFPLRMRTGRWARFQ